MEASTRFWTRRCSKCQARKTSRQTIRWPVISMGLPNAPGHLVSFDYFGPLPTTDRGNTYILLLLIASAVTHLCMPSPLPILQPQAQLIS